MSVVCLAGRPAAHFGNEQAQMVPCLLGWHSNLTIDDEFVYLMLMHTYPHNRSFFFFFFYIIKNNLKDLQLDFSHHSVLSFLFVHACPQLEQCSPTLNPDWIGSFLGIDAFRLV